jgi:hypothetical protein
MSKFSDLDQFLSDFVKKGPVGCGVAVAKDGEILHEKYFGYANLEKQIPITAENVYRQYSSTKVVVCTAAMMLLMVAEVLSRWILHKAILGSTEWAQVLVADGPVVPVADPAVETRHAASPENAVADMEMRHAASLQWGNTVTVAFRACGEGLCACADDEVYVAVFCPARGEVAMSGSVWRKKERVALTLPDGWQGLEVHLWVFAMDYQGRASRSVYAGGLEAGVVDNDGDVVGEEFDGDGQQDDAEELAQHEDHLVAQPALDSLQQDEHHIVDDDVQQEAEHDVDGGVLGAEREEGGDGAGAGDEGEGHGDDAGAGAGALVLDELAPHDHLQGQEKEHEGSGHGEGGDVDAEEVEQRLAHEEEGHEESQGHARGLQGLDVFAAVLHADEDGNGACDVDDGEHDDERAENLDDVYLMYNFKHDNYLCSLKGLFANCKDTKKN